MELDNEKLSKDVVENLSKKMTRGTLFLFSPSQSILYFQNGGIIFMTGNWKFDTRNTEFIRITGL